MKIKFDLEFLKYHRKITKLSQIKKKNNNLGCQRGQAQGEGIFPNRKICKEIQTMNKNTKNATA